MVGGDGIHKKQPLTPAAFGDQLNDSINGAMGSGANSVKRSGTSSNRSSEMSSDRQLNEQQRRGSGMSSKQ